MRMWLVTPKLMCDKHLLGEHVEMHMFVGCLLKGKSIQGYIDKGLVDVSLLTARHGALVKEMLGVSDTTVAKRCKLLGVSRPVPGYWNKVRAGKVVPLVE